MLEINGNRDFLFTLSFLWSVKLNSVPQIVSLKTLFENILKFQKKYSEECKLKEFAYIVLICCISRKALLSQIYVWMP